MVQLEGDKILAVAAGAGTARLDEECRAICTFAAATSADGIRVSAVRISTDEV